MPPARASIARAPAGAADAASALRLCAALAAGCLFALLPLAQLAWRLWSAAAAALCGGARASSAGGGSSGGSTGSSTVSSNEDIPFPARMAYARWGAHRTASANGLRMHYVEKGPAASPAGGRPPLMLCLHGFPECWYAWRWVLAAFSSHYRVVAPDLRGFGETARGEAGASWWRARDSRLEVLVADVAALLEALGETECVLVGHDWGAVVAYAFATAHPAAVRRLVILNGPHPAAMWDSLTLGQVLRSFYLFVFQLPLLPEVWLRSGGYAFLRGAMLGGRRGPGAMGARRRGEPLALDARDVEAFTWALSRAGALTSAVNWYRAIFSHNAAYHARAGMEREASIRAPLLIVWGEDDGALGGAASPAATERYAQPGAFTLALVPRCSHWTQQDAVRETLQAMAHFLRMRVPDGMKPADGEAAYTVHGAPLREPRESPDAPWLHDVSALRFDE